MHDIAIYGSHDANICISPSPGVYRIYELERIAKIRNFNLAKNQAASLLVLIMVRDLIKEEYGIIKFDTCYFSELDEAGKYMMTSVFSGSPMNFVEADHHLAHAACALYQSPYDECLIFSYDAGGKSIDGGIETFCIYHAIRSKGIIKKLVSLPIDVCGPYTMLAIPIPEIKKDDMWSGYLTYAGKKMGLAAYGTMQMDWFYKIKEFYYKTSTLDRMEYLGKEINENLSGVNSFTGILHGNSKDLAATSQKAFEYIVLNAVMPYIHRYSYPIILTGGGALNVLLNQRFKDLISKTQTSANASDFVFVPPNPNDCGLAFGMMAMATEMKDQSLKPINIQYNGVGILDMDNLMKYVEKYDAKKTNNDQLAQYLCDGKIIGVIAGNSEVGPRALGNRSILAYPGYPEMKDKINKIKHREFYRPFAPVVKSEDMSKYFSFKGESPYMSFAPKISVDWYDRVPAVVHKDGTSRVQSVSRDQNVFLYQLISEVEKISGIGMLLNTSFNIKGKPILTSLEDAFEVLETTELDAVYTEGYLFIKKVIK